MEKSKNSKNILIINDMPGYGKVALAAMLPILSNFGHSVYNLPTALVSNTLDYGTFSILDTTDYMVRAIDAWKKLGFSFDCITTGFLASAEQVDIIREFIDSQRKEDLLVMTDPIMADDGKLYNGVTEETVENMRRLIGVADVIVPNLTEAEFLTGKCLGRESLAAGEARELVEETVQSAERARLLRTCMAELHEDYREALFLVYFEGLSHAETAAVMGKREKQVADLIYRGKIALRKRLEQEGITDAYNG